jgi:hypothetical protein
LFGHDIAELSISDEVDAPSIQGHEALGSTGRGLVIVQHGFGGANSGVLDYDASLPICCLSLEAIRLFFAQNDLLLFFR